MLTESRSDFFTDDQRMIRDMAHEYSRAELAPNAARWDAEGYVPDAVVWHIGNASWTAGFSRPGADNARLVARNRLATQVKFMPLRVVPRILAVEAGALGRAARQRRFRATLAGKLASLGWLPRLLRERHRLRREGDLASARSWLGMRTDA